MLLFLLSLALSVLFISANASCTSGNPRALHLPTDGCVKLTGLLGAAE